MIIQCPKCETKFRVAESKVAKAGVKVRCSRCAHLFIVRKDPDPTLPEGFAQPPSASARPNPVEQRRPEVSGSDGASASSPSAHDPEPGARPPGQPDPASQATKVVSADLTLSGPPRALTRDLESHPSPPASAILGSTRGPPPLPPSPPPLPNALASPPLPFSQDLSQDLPDDSESGVRFPPPPALTNDLGHPAADEALPNAGWDSLHHAPDGAFDSDPFTETQARPAPAALTDSPFAPLTGGPIPPRPSSGSVPLSLPPPTRGSSFFARAGRTTGRPQRVPTPRDPTSLPEPAPPPPVASLRWPPWLGLALGLCAAIFWTPDLGFDLARRAHGLEDVKTVDLKVRPYGLASEPSLWIVSGRAETRARPHPEGVRVRVVFKRADTPVARAETFLGLAIPTDVLAAGPASTARFIAGQGAPSVPAAQRSRFVAVVHALEVPPEELEFEVLYGPPDVIPQDVVDAPPSSR